MLQSLEKWVDEGLDKVQALLLEEEGQVLKYFEASSQISLSCKNLEFLKDSPEVLKKYCFESLMPNFLAGLQFEKRGSEWHLTERFVLGKKEAPINFTLRLPEMQVAQVLKSKAKAFHRFEELQLPYFSSEAKALLFRPSEKLAFLFFSEFPGVILKYMCDEVHEFLLKAYSI